MLHPTTLVLAFDPFGILQGLSNVLTSFITGLLNLVSQGILTLTVLWSFVQNMPLAYTTQNPIIIQSWRTMTVIADALLGLFLVVGTVQILYGQSTRSLEMPLPQFLGRAILTALLIHLSAFLGEMVLTINNALSDVVTATLGNAITQLNRGAQFSTTQTALFAAILVLVFAIGLLRLAMQGVKRIILFNLLFVLSGPAFLLSFHPSTQPVFAAWARRLLATGLEQSIQFLGLGLGIRFLLTSGQTGLITFLIAIAMMNLAIEIPSLVSHMIAGAPSVGLRDNSIAPVIAGAAALAAKFL